MPKKRLNAFDFTILFLLVAVIAGAAFYFTKVSGSRDWVKATFVVEFRNKEQGFEEKIAVGDLVKDSIRNFDIGVVEKVEAVPELTTTVDETSRKMIETVVPGEVTIYVTISCDAVENEKEIAVAHNGYVLKVGKQVFIKGKGYGSAGYIFNLKTEAGK